MNKALKKLVLYSERNGDGNGCKEKSQNIQ